MTIRDVPAHVTILFSFRAVVDDLTADRAEVLVDVSPRSEPPSPASVFPGEVVWLRPEPTARFTAIIRTFAAEFPDCPPFGGEFPDIVPHLTVGVGLEPAVADLLEVELAPRLPLSTTVDRLTLLVEDTTGNWSRERTWPLLGGAEVGETP